VKIFIFFGLLVLLLANDCLNNMLDCLSFEWVSIRLERQTCFRGLKTFVYIFYYVFFSTLKKHGSKTKSTFLKFLPICVHVGLGIVNINRFFLFKCTYCARNLLQEKLEVENLNGNRKTY
jgi:hypothetical protein